jgi:hypothetical protein
MVKPFIERFQLWLHERAEQRRDTFIGWLLLLAGVVLAQDAHSLIASHHLTLRAIAGSVLVLAFVVIHIRQSPRTWVVLMVLALVALAEAPLVFASAQARPLSVRLFSATFAAATAIAAFIYSLIIRKRFARGTRTI